MFSQDGLRVEAFGSVLFGPEGDMTSIITDGKVFGFSKDGPAPTGWEHFVYLSPSSLPAPAKEGGDLTALHTWQKRNTGSNEAPTTIRKTLTSVQTDAKTMGKVDALRRAGEAIGAFFITEGPTGARKGEWWPSAMFAVTDLPTAQDQNYSTFSFTLTQQAPPADLDLDALVNQTGLKDTAARFFDGVFFDEAAFAPVAVAK
jgi:hypothetical protein